MDGETENSGSLSPVVTRVSFIYLKETRVIVSFYSLRRLRQGRPCICGVFNSALLNVCFDWCLYRCTVILIFVKGKSKKVKTMKLKLHLMDRMGCRRIVRVG